MTREEKTLVFQDLSCRLPYNVVLHTSLGDVILDKRHRNLGEPYYVGGCKNGGWSCGCLGDIIADILGIYQYKSILYHENRWKKRTLLKAIKRRNKAVIYKFKDD